MSPLRIAVAAGLAAGLFLPMLPAQAQTSLGNKSIPGVCMISRGAVLSNSTVGKAADARLKQLAQQARTQLDNERQPLENSIKAFQEKEKSMSASQRESQQKSLQQRMANFQNKARELDARVRLTRSKATQQIAGQLDPIVGQLYQQKSCGILLDRDSVLGGNPAGDLTSGAVAALNKKMTTISFNLAPLPQQQPAAGK